MVEPYHIGGPNNSSPIASLGPFPEDEVKPCALKGTPVYESGHHFVLANGDWLSVEAVVEMFESTLGKVNPHCVPSEWILIDMLERFGDRKKRKPMNKKLAQSVLHRFNFTCVKCGGKDDLQVDHIVPVSKGGKDKMENLQILCQPCNLKKGTKENEQFMAHG